MRGAIPPLPHYVFTAWCLVKDRDNSIFTFTFTFTSFPIQEEMEEYKIRKWKLVLYTVSINYVRIMYVTNEDGLDWSNEVCKWI